MYMYIQWNIRFSQTIKVLHVVYQHFSSIKCCLLFGIVHQESNVAFKRASFSQYFAGELQISLAGEFSSALL